MRAFWPSEKLGPMRPAKNAMKINTKNKRLLWVEPLVGLYVFVFVWFGIFRFCNFVWLLARDQPSAKSRPNYGSSFRSMQVLLNKKVTHLHRFTYLIHK